MDLYTELWPSLIIDIQSVCLHMSEYFQYIIINYVIFIVIFVQIHCLHSVFKLMLLFRWCGSDIQSIQFRFLLMNAPKPALSISSNCCSRFLNPIPTLSISSKFLFTNAPKPALSISSKFRFSWPKVRPLKESKRLF